MNDLEPFENIVDEIRDNKISESSKAVYISSTCRFLAWLMEKKPELVCAEFKDFVLMDGRIDKKRIIQYISESIRNPDPIHFDRYLIRDFTHFVESLPAIS
jgi:hypothetical protein